MKYKIMFRITLSVLLAGIVQYSFAEKIPTIDNIIEGIRNSKTGFFEIENFLVVCERTKSEDIIPSQYSGGYINTEFIVAKRKNDWFVSKTFTQKGEIGADGKNRIAGIWTPLEPKIAVIKNHLLLEWSKEDDVICIVNFGQGGNIHQCFDYFRHIGWNISRYIIESEAVDYAKVSKIFPLGDYLDHPFLPEYLEQHKKKYKIHPQQENIDGFQCWVVEYPGMDKFWVDTEHGFAVRKRVYHWEYGKPKKFAIHNLDWKEILPGIWLPQKQIVDKYASIISEKEDIWDKVTAEMEYEVHKIQIDDVAASLFEINPPIGTQILDSSRGEEYVISNPNFDPFAGAIAQGIRANRFVMVRAVCIIIGSVLILFSVWRILRKKAV